jgi:2-iminobutanoate/2-iminopropanoate deaminase
MKKFIDTDRAPAPIGPYNQAISYNNLLFVSGQIAIDPNTGNIIDDSIEHETEQVMRNLQEILAAAGTSLENVLKCSIFIRDMDQFVQINGVYGRFFKEVPPARETVEVSRLPKDVNVEISCIAYL